ncbi:hypothetical protein ACTID9_08650 [Brevibacillus fluminis]|uniref:hypothetical protein n=1 Tax=Brevibacillus fluminis TaxID=511487 RepID=UPI003F891725
MKKLLISIVFLCFLQASPIISLAEEKTPNSPIRNLINWFDHWYRKRLTLEQHIKYTCQEYENSKVDGALWIWNFRIHECKKVGDEYMIRATYIGNTNGKTRYVKAKVKRYGDVWINEGFDISFSCSYM